MASFNIDTKAHSSARKQNRIAAMKDSPNENERKVAAKKLRPSMKVGLPTIKKEEIKLVDKILGEEKCGDGHYWCSEENCCKPIPNVDESVTIEDAFGNKFVEFIDLITPESLLSQREEKDHEVSMAHKQISKSQENLKKVKKSIGKKEKNLPAWMQAKLTDTEHNTDAVAGYTAKEGMDLAKADMGDVIKDFRKSKKPQFKGKSDEKIRQMAIAAKLEAERQNEEVDLDESGATDLAINLIRSTQGDKPRYLSNRSRMIRNLKQKALERHLARKKSKNKNEEVELEEAVRLPSEFGHLLSVIVSWRGRSQYLRMFFPQAKLPTKKDIQAEIEKVYPGGRVIQFATSDLPSNHTNFDSPLFKVTTKEEVELKEECGKCKKTPCECSKSDDVEIEEKKGLWDRMHDRRKAGKPKRKPGDKNYPETLNVEGKMTTARANVGASKCWDGYKAKGTKKKNGKVVPNCVKEDVNISGGSVGTIVIGGDLPKK